MVTVVDEAESLWSQGRRLNDVGQFADAAAALAAARDLVAGVDTPEARRVGIRVDVTCALTDLELTGYAAAASRLSAATEAAHRLDAPDLVALTHIQHGVIDARSGLWAAASDQLRHVLPLFAHIGPVEQCSTLITLGLADLSLCRVGESRTSLERARAIAEEHHLPVHLFKATHNLGCAAYIAGELPAALRLMTTADAMPVEVARERARLDLAAVLLEAGLVDQARETLTAALDTARATGQRLDEGDILLDLSRCAVLDDNPPLARALAEQAAAVFDSLQAEARRAAAELLIAGLDVREGTGLEAAVHTADGWSARGSLVGTGTELVDVVLVRAEARLAQGALEECAAELARVPHPGVGLLSRRLHELHVRARLAHRQGDEATFAAAVADSSRLSATAQGAMSSVEVRAALAQHVAPTASLDLERSLLTGRADLVFATVERWRAASHRGLAPTVAPDARLTEQLSRLRWLRSGIAPVAELDDQARAREVAELEHTISLSAWQEDRRSGVLDQPVTLEQVRAALPEQSCHLTFTHTPAGCHAVVIDPSGERLVEIGPTAEVVEAVRALRRDLRGSAYAHARPDLRARLRASVAGSAARLGELLLTPVRAEIEDSQRLLITAGDVLHAVPWAALPGLEGRPVTVAPSATVWHRLSRDAQLTARSVRAVAGPHVARGVRESADVAAIWRAAGAAASSESTPSSAASTAGALAEADIVHIAAHGHHADDSPLFSSLLMSDGPLFAHELIHGVGARHVVLSACDVGRSRVRAGGEALGLTAALLALGVQTVIAALAPIPDEVSAAATTAYHRELSRGQDAATSLARAIRENPGAEALCCFGGDLRVAATSGM